MTEIPDWQIAVIDGEPEVVVNAEALRVLMRQSPLGVVEARRVLIERGVPEYLLDEPAGITRRLPDTDSHRRCRRCGGLLLVDLGGDEHGEIEGVARCLDCDPRPGPHDSWGQL